MNTEEKIAEWMRKVLAAKASSEPGAIDTYRMIVDIDRIIAEEFGHIPVLLENQ